MESYAYILDYLPQGRAEEKGYHKTPIALAIGETEFKLLELIPKNDTVIAIGERVYIGKEPEKRAKILSVCIFIGLSSFGDRPSNLRPFSSINFRSVFAPPI